MCNEMKKFYKNSAILVLTALALLLSIVMPVVFLSDYESYDYSTGTEVTYTGLDGIKERKEQVKSITGVLEIKTLNEALALYKSIPDEEKAYAKVQEQYPDLMRLLKEAYAPFGEEAYFSLSNIESANDFYDRTIPQIKSRANNYSGENYLFEAEIENIAKLVKKIETPYRYEFIDHWTVLFKSLTFVYIFITFTALFMSSQLFSYEKEQNMDQLLVSLGKKKLLRIGYNKMISLTIYMSVEFIVCCTVVCGIVFGSTGISGWNVSLQILPDFFAIPYNWSIGDLFLISLVISWLCIISLASIGTLVNSLFQKTYVSLVFSTLLFLLPLGLRHSDYVAKGIQRILYLHPTNGVSMLSYIHSLFSYGIGSMQVTTPVMVGVIAVVCTIMCFLLSPRLFVRKLH